MLQQGSRAGLAISIYCLARREQSSSTESVCQLCPTLSPATAHRPRQLAILVGAVMLARREEKNMIRCEV